LLAPGFYDRVHIDLLKSRRSRIFGPLASLTKNGSVDGFPQSPKL
jgi:hypothetical protein